MLNRLQERVVRGFMSMIEFDNEGYFVRIPIELVRKIGIKKKEKARIRMVGRKMILELELKIKRGVKQNPLILFSFVYCSLFRLR
jgi:hypothetical protein